MTQRVWNGTSQGRYLDSANWLNGVPVAADTWLIDGAGDAPVQVGGIFGIQNNPSVDLYGPAAVPSLLGDPDPSLIPVAAPIVSPGIAVNGGKAVVGLVLIDSTIASSTTLSVTGIAVMQGNYTNTLAGTISVQPTAGAAADANGNNGELDIEVFSIGSVDPATFTKRDYTPTVTNAGTINGGAGAGFNIGFTGDTPQLNKVGGILQVLGGYDAFVNTGTIALADSSMQVQGGFFAGSAGYNAFLNDGLISLGPANPSANPFNLNAVVPGSAYFDTQISGTGTIRLTGAGANQAGAEFLGGIGGNTIVIADATASFFDAGLSTYAYSGALDFADSAGTLSLPIGLAKPFLPISGFRAGDRITVRNAGSNPALAWDAANNQLTIENNFSGILVPQAVLTIEGSYRLSDFTATATAAGITVTTDALACFAAGTRIATPDGEVAIERLAVGDRVLTQGGRQRPVMWAGCRRVDCDRHAEPHTVRPVRVRAHAIAPGVPARDLLLSPDHALFVEGLLIPARLLVNHHTIAVAHDVRHVSYHHIELDRHDVILAEAMPAESFLDTGHRDGFTSSAGASAFAGSDADRAALSCAPFAVDAARVEPVWRLLAGPHLPHRPALTADPALALLCDGRLVVPDSVDGERHRFALRGARSVRIVSRAMRPSDRLPWLDDRRLLGVQVRSIVAHGRDAVQIPRAGAAIGRGWHDDEPDGRWTDGDAELAMPAGTTALEIAAGMQEGYPAGERRRIAA